MDRKDLEVDKRSDYSKMRLIL